MKKIGLLVFISLVLTVIYPSAQVRAAKPFTDREILQAKILIEQDQYKLAKFEPPQGAYLGAYIIQDTLIDGNMAKFMEITGKKHVSFFKYVAYGSPAPVAWIEECQVLGVVPHIAFEPNQGLDKVEDDIYLRKFARDLNETGSPIFMRFASEMNGNWTSYSGDPPKYIEKWQLLHDVLAEEAPQVMMVWTVFTFPQKTVLSYYPGDSYVDWVGVNIYNVIYHNNDLRMRADNEDPLALLDYVYNTFSTRKPIQISEFGATHYTITDQRYYVDFAMQKISRMYTGLKERYPRVKSIFYFDVNNLVNAPAGRRINNYAITDNEAILKQYATLIKDPYYLTDICENQEGVLDPEWFTVADKCYLRSGFTYIPADTVPKYFQVSVSKEKNGVTVQKGNLKINMPLDQKIMVVNGVKNNIAVTPVVNNQVVYLPLKLLVTQLGYTIHWDKKKEVIVINKRLLQ